MAFTQDFRTQRRNYEDGETRIGEKDRLWYDSNTNTIRISDGETPGGVVVGGSGGGSDYTLPTASTTTKGGVKVDGTTITINNQVISATQPDLSSYATQSYVTSRGYLTSVGTISYNDLSNKPTLFSGSYTDLTNKPTLFDGAYSSLSGTPTIYTSAYIGTTNLDFSRESASQTLTGVSIDGSVVWTNPSPAPGTPWRTTINAASGKANIVLYSGLPGFGSSVSWTLDETKLTFPDNSQQTTAFTGSIAYASVTGTPTLATVATSGSYSDLTNKPTIPTTVTVNGTSITLGSSGTVTAAAGTLTGTTLNSTVVSSSLTSVGTLTNLSVTNTITGSISGNAATATKLATARAINGVDFDGSAAITITAAAGTLSGSTLASGVTASSLTSVGTLTSLTSTGSVTANHTTAFIAGDNAISNVALQIPREGAIRNLYNGSGNNMYFDVSIGGASQGQFQFRSSSAYTNILTMSPTAFTVNTEAVVTARTPSFGRLPWNSALDTELTIDDYRWRITNSGGIYAQVISNTGGTKNSAWTAVAAISGQAVAQGGSTGILLPNNSWTTLYTFGSMASAGDTVTVTFQDKSQGRIYRVTFMRSDNGSTTGYNIIAERLL